MLNTIIYFLVGLLGISLIILVHESGHFIAACILGIDVEVVSIGLGPGIFKWGKNPRFQIGVIPFGGLCKLKGEDDLKRALARKDTHVRDAESGSLYAASPLKRMVLYFFGPLMNIIFAVICLFVCLNLPVPVKDSQPRVVLACEYEQLFPGANTSALEAGMHTGQLVESVDGIPVGSWNEFEQLLTERKYCGSVVLRADGQDYTVSPENGSFGFAEFVEPVVSEVAEGSPEAEAGLRAGDRILTANSMAVENMFDIFLLQHSSADEVLMTILRDGKEAVLVYVPEVLESGLLKVNFKLRTEGKLVRTYTPLKALGRAVAETGSIFSSGVDALVGLFGGGSLKGTVAGTFSASESIGEITVEGFNQNFVTGVRICLYLMAAVSTSLAIANLLPLPSLDGGLIMLSLVELVKGKNSSPKVYLFFQIMGFVIVITFVALMTFL